MVCVSSAPPTVGAAEPDRAFRTPVAQGSAAARSAVSADALRSGLARYLAGAGGRSGAWVLDDASGEVIFQSGAGRRLQLASNTKLFTTAAALDRLGAGGRLETTVWTAESAVSGVLDGDLYLVGDGDPSLASASYARKHNVPLTSLASLAKHVRKAGIRRVKGKLRIDATVFDRRRGTGVGGWSTYIGPLSGLIYNSGSGGGDPAMAAGRAFERYLRKAGVRVRGVVRGKLPGALRDEDPIATERSLEIARLVDETNETSNNFFAEMLLKRLAAGESERGTTRGGAARSRRIARELGARVHQRDGSGLSRSNRAAPKDVGELLAAMLDHQAAHAFMVSLPVAGREGTVRNRMRGTAAQGECRAKTGTLSGVSALSGYCGDGDRPVVFSILMQGVELGAAHSIQDRAAALIARYG